MNRLRTLRPERYVQLAHYALDELPDLNSPGLLAHILRHTDDWHFSLDALVAAKPGLGRQAAYKAMRTLVAYGYIVKVQWQDARGRWHTETFRSAHPHTDEDLAEIAALFAPGAAAVVIVRRKDGTAREVPTTVRTASIMSRHGKTPITKHQVEPTDGFPTVGKPAVGKPTVGNPSALEKNSEKTEEEEGNARVGDVDVRSEPGPAADAAASSGVVGERQQAATMAAMDFVAELARTVLPRREAISGQEHQELAAQLDAARAVVDIVDGLSWPEFEDYLRQGWWRADGRRRFNDFAAVLRTRLGDAHIRSKALVWAIEQRDAQGSTAGPQGGREEFTGGRPDVEGVCGVHKTAYTPSGTCLRCDAETAVLPTDVAFGGSNDAALEDVTDDLGVSVRSEPVSVSVPRPPAGRTVVDMESLKQGFALDAAKWK